jgi:hypothetical protein
MNWPFFQDWAGGSKKEMYGLLFLFCQELLVGRLFYTRVTFLKKVSFFYPLSKNHYYKDERQQPTVKYT